jgi:hypothetical protein
MVPLVEDGDSSSKSGRIKMTDYRWASARDGGMAFHAPCTRATRALSNPRTHSAASPKFQLTGYNPRLTPDSSLG